MYAHVHGDISAWGLGTHQCVLRGPCVLSSPSPKPQGRAVWRAFAFLGTDALTGTIRAARSSVRCPLDPEWDIPGGITDTVGNHPLSPSPWWETAGMSGSWQGEHR